MNYKVWIPVAGLVVGAGLWIISKIKMNGTYFTFDELIRSDTATAKGIANSPNLSQRANLANLIKLLDRIRARFGRAIKVTSGYRSEALNRIVGGASDSQHLRGQAADLVPAAGGSVADIFRAAIQVGGYDQLIIETQGTSKWVHVSVSSSPRGQILAYNNGSYRDITKNWQSYV